MTASTYLKVETSENGNLEPGRVSEVHVLEPDVALGILEVKDFAASVLGIDSRDRVDQLDVVGGRTASGTHVGDVGEDVSGLDGT